MFDKCKTGTFPFLNKKKKNRTSSASSLVVSSSIASRLTVDRKEEGGEEGGEEKEENEGLGLSAPQSVGELVDGEAMSLEWTLKFWGNE